MPQIRLFSIQASHSTLSALPIKKKEKKEHQATNLNHHDAVDGENVELRLV